MSKRLRTNIIKCTQVSNIHLDTIQYMQLQPAVRASLIRYFKTQSGVSMTSVHLSIALGSVADMSKLVRGILDQMSNIARFRLWVQHVPDILHDVMLCRTLVDSCRRLYNKVAFIEDTLDFEGFLFANDLVLKPHDPSSSLFLSPAMPLLTVAVALRVWDVLDRPELTKQEIYRVGFFVHLCTRWSVDTTVQRLDVYGNTRVAWALDVTNVLRRTFHSCRAMPYLQIYQNLLRWMYAETPKVVGEFVRRTGSVFSLVCWDNVQRDILLLLKEYITGNIPTRIHVGDSGEDCSICLETVDSDDAIELSCRHTFHLTCIESWNAVNNTCPLCRALFKLETLPMKWREWTKPDRLNPQQLHAAENCVRHRFSIVTGAGGTGKTEVAAVVGQYIAWLMQGEFQYPSVCVAPSGKATEVMKNRLGHYKEAFSISTIHRWIIGGHKTSCIPFLFIDEASMVDLWTTWHLLQTARNEGVRHIVLFGDPQQLSPVDSRGTILDAFMSQESCRLVTSLTTNYRSTPGLLSLMDNLRRVALEARGGIQSEWFDTSNSMLCTVPNDDHSALYAKILEMLHTTDPRQTRIIVGRRAPILQPHGKSTEERDEFLLGVHHFFNPTTRTAAEFCVGDVVRSTVNITEDITKGGFQLVVANGSEGVVTAVSPLRVCFQGRQFEKNDDNPTNVRQMFEKLEWGTISTVHKFQGSESHTILAVFLGDFMEHNTMQLLYTAASRARQRLILIMEVRNLALFCTRPGHVVRNSRFNATLVQALLND
jgi:hypothetical protein